MGSKRDVVDLGNVAYLKGGRAAVVMGDYSGFLDDKNVTAVTVTPAKLSPVQVKDIEFMPFGPKNSLPVDIMKKIHENTIVGSNIEFKAKIAYGDSLLIARKKRSETGEIELEELLPEDVPEIFKFIDDSNYFRMMQEVANDETVFWDSFVELVFGKRLKGAKPKIVQVRHKEMCFSRVSKQNDNGDIEYHGISAKWGEGTSPEDVIVTKLLNRQLPMYNLKVRTGLIPNPETGETADEGEDSYMLSLNLPVPGRFYYNRPYWWSIFIDWYDFSCAIPKFKKSLIKNQMVLKYHVSINTNFWAKLYNSEGIARDDQVKQMERKKKFLQDLNDFLSGEENAGKSFVSHFSYDKINKYEENDIIIKPIESFIKGGEYIEDSEEATNVICNTMSVHPSLKGASPGKNKSINGTEARELFIISNAMSKDVRDMMLLPLYIAKEINGWDKNVFFYIKNVELTTLDKGTGATKNIGNEKV